VYGERNERPSRTERTPGTPKCARAHLRTCEKRISIQITFQFLVPFLRKSMQGRQRTHLSSGLERALVKYRTNGAGRYTYDRRFYLSFRRHFEYVLPSTGVLLRRFTLRPPGAFFSMKIEKLRGSAFTMTLSSDEQLNGLKGKRSQTFGNPITENTRETTFNESYSIRP